MEYSPALLASLTVQAIILGGVLGVLYSILAFSRLILGEGRITVPKSLVRWFPALFQPIPVASEKKSRVRSVCLYLLRFFEDVFFCLSAIVGIILLAYVGNNGRIRWFILLGVLIGFVVYMGTVGVLFSRISSALAVLIRRVIRMILRIMIIPLKKMARGIKSVLGSCKRALERYISERRNEEYHLREMKRILESASNGFGCVENFDLSSHASSERNVECDLHKIKDVKKGERRSVYGRTKKREDTGERSPKVGRKA